MPVPANQAQTMTQSPRNRKSPRKKAYDYTVSGVYFVTICTHERELMFGDVNNETMRYTELGQIALDCWLMTPDHFPHIEVDCFVVMPNHVHAIIIIHDRENDSDKNENNDADVGNRHACSLPTQPTNQSTPPSTPPTRGIYKNSRYIPPGAKSGSLGAIVGSYKSAVTKIANRTLSDPPSPLWQRFYHDHIIRNEKEFNMIRQYVLTNTARWDEDRFNE